MPSSATSAEVLTPGTPGAPLDLLVLGSGVAGLSAAVRAAQAHGMRVGVLTKGELDQATTRWAQGGVAAVLHADPDSPDSTDLHLLDTLSAGAGLCDEDAVRVLVDEGPGRVNGLIALGAMFDRDVEGNLELAREGGHTLPRIVHAGGTETGAEIERALVDAVRATAAALHEHSFATDFIIEGGRCRGVRAVSADDPSGEEHEVRAHHVLLATGGAGQMFSVTTNPIEATGDGIAMALRAGVAVADIEFVQFHPTALHRATMPRLLLSEALRGHGAKLRDHTGERFVDELLPRDEVSRAITGRMLATGTDHVWLDVSELPNFPTRFPTLTRELREMGFDPPSQLLPVAPAAHYLCGGVVTDLDGATTLPGLWAAGEVACSGVHGANRLASNSLLEGMVFGFRVVEAIERGKDGAEATGAMRSVLPVLPVTDETTSELPVIGGRPATGWTVPGPLAWRPSSAVGPSRSSKVGVDALKVTLQQAMTIGAGVLRSAASLEEAGRTVEKVRADLGAVRTLDDVQLANLLDVAEAVLAVAKEREESRGAHTRTDHPGRLDAFLLRLILATPP